jgi:hypothetical protein
MRWLMSFLLILIWGQAILIGRAVTERLGPTLHLLLILALVTLFLEFLAQKAKKKC